VSFFIAIPFTVLRGAFREGKPDSHHTGCRRNDRLRLAVRPTFSVAYTGYA
jgi:hypothetical protein